MLLSQRQEIKRGVIAALPIIISFVPFALVLGAQAIQKGMAAGEIGLMTAMNFAGGSEFVAVNLWSSPPHLLLIAFMTLLVNSRHILMGAALTPYLKNLSKRKVLFALFFMCDESWALSFADAKKSAKQLFNYYFYMGAGLALYVAWVVSTLMGAIVGPFLGDITQYGFDMAFVAVFLVLLKDLTRVAGYLLLRNKVLSPRATKLLEAIPGCVLIAVIAPAFATSNVANLLALTITFLLASRLSLLPTVILSIVATGLLRYFLS